MTIGDDAEMQPRLALGTTPYAAAAARAADVDRLGGKPASAYRLADEPLTWDQITGVPDGLADGDDDRLAAVLCAEGQVLKFGAAGWSCGVDADSGGDVTGVSAGAGLTGGAATGEAILAVDFAPAGDDAGSAVTVARADHLHDQRYPSRTELATPGALNDAANPIDFSRLKGVPAGFADGVDNDTSYSFAGGLSLNGSVVSAVAQPISIASFGSGPITHFTGPGFVLESTAANSITIRSVAGVAFLDFSVLFPTGCGGAESMTQAHRFSTNPGESSTGTLCSEGSVAIATIMDPVSNQSWSFRCIRIAGNANICQRVL